MGASMRQAARAFAVAALASLTTRAALAQARVLSEPPEPSLLGITRGWSSASRLGDLRELRTGSDHLELRVWGGYELAAPTQGIILRRSNGRWSAFLARVLRCETQIPRSVGDTASRTTMQGFVREARRHCAAPLADVAAGAQIVTADSLAVDSLSIADSAIGRAWNAAMRAGVLELPARIDRARSIDGQFTYVVEVRRGAEYRASEIERVEPADVDADRRMHDVYAAVARLLSLR